MLYVDSSISSDSRSVSTNMSGSVGHNWLNQSLLQSKLNSSGIPANTLFQAACVNQVSAQTRKSTSKKFSGKSLIIRKSNLAMGSRRSVTVVPHAVLATDRNSGVIYTC